MASTIEQLEAMKQLQPNWDGYHADPPSPAVLDLAKEFVTFLQACLPADHQDAIFVTPGRAGGVLIEWADATTEHELEIDPNGRWGFLHTDRVTGATTGREFMPTKATVIHPGVLLVLRSLIAA